MIDGPLDPAQWVAFDLERGIVHVDGERPHAVVPAAALGALLGAAAEVDRAAFARAVGEAMGARIASRLGGVDAVRAATPEAVLTQVAAELAVAGLGALAVERWGRALIVVVDTPFAADADDWLEGLLGAAFSVATGLDADAAALERDAGRAFFMLTSKEMVGRVRGLRYRSRRFLDALADLHDDAPAEGAPT
jgi:hypothetical protein